MNVYREKDGVRTAAKSRWRPLLIGTALAGLLFGGPAAAEIGAMPNATNATAAPADRAAAFEIIRKANARTQAEELAAMEKDLTPLEREWGVKMLGLRLTAAGYGLDFRSKVLDPEKAAPLLDRSFHLTPFVLVEKSGAKLGVPFTEKAGSLRSSVTTTSQIKKGRNYSALFANPGHHVRSGDEVTIVIGQFRAENIPVQ
jgi:hypothetical protein